MLKKENLKIKAVEKLNNYLLDRFDLFRRPELEIEKLTNVEIEYLNYLLNDYSYYNEILITTYNSKKVDETLKELKNLTTKILYVCSEKLNIISKSCFINYIEKHNF